MGFDIPKPADILFPFSLEPPRFATITATIWNFNDCSNYSSGAAQLKRTGIVRGCSQSWSDLFPFLTSSRKSDLSHGVSVKQFKDEIKEISFLFCFGFANDLTPGFPNSSYKVVSLAWIRFASGNVFRMRRLVQIVRGLISWLAYLLLFLTLYFFLALQTTQGEGCLEII